VKKLGQIDLVFGQQALDARLDQSCAHARHYGRDAAQQLLIDHGGLRKICNLSRPADVRQRGQPVILQHRAQQDVGAEILWRGLHAALQFVAGDDFAPDLELAIGAMNGNPCALDQRKQRRRLGRDLYLLVIFFRLQFAITGQQGVINFGGTLYRVRKQRRRDAVEFGVRGIEKDQPVFAKNAGVELGIGIRERLALGITFA